MAEIIMGKSANEVWKKAVSLLLNEKYTLNGRTGEIYELLHTFISIENPRQKWIYDRIPPISIGFALAELVWIMNGEDDAEVINFWNPDLKKFTGKSKAYHGAYGKRIRSHYGFDQLEKAYQTLQNKPESRQVVIQIYDTKVDFPMDNGIPRDADIPCNICSMLKVREGRLEWSQIMRSNDVILGLPYNIVQFTGLQEILAGWLELEVGTYNHYSDSLHLYQRDVEKIAINQKNNIQNADSLELNKNESERIFKDIYERMKFLVTGSSNEKEIYSLGILDSNYVAYDNMMSVIVAYVAHRQHKYDLEKELIKRNTNELYSEMWNSWINKKKVI